MKEQTDRLCRVVIFDLDGLLADSEILHCQAYRQTLAEWDIHLSEEGYAEHWIRHGRTIVDFVSERQLPLDPDEVRNRKFVIHAQLVETALEPMPGALPLLERLHGRKRLALASSSWRINVEHALRKLEMADYFEFIACGEDAPRYKPHPDIFLYVAERMGVKPEECTVLEDAEKGIVAARGAGMRVIAVPNRLTRSNDFSQATAVVGSLAEVTAEVIDGLSG